MQLYPRQRRVVFEHELGESVQQDPRERAMAVASKNEEPNASVVLAKFWRAESSSGYDQK